MSNEQNMGIKDDKGQMSQSASSPKVAPTAGGVTVPGVSHAQVRVRRYQIQCMHDQVVSADIADQMLVALECAHAMDIPYNEGQRILAKHGWRAGTETGREFTARMIEDALSKARP